MTRAEYTALLAKCTAATLPKGLPYADREQAIKAAARARGWLKSSFFNEESTETEQHVAALRKHWSMT